MEELPKMPTNSKPAQKSPSTGKLSRAGRVSNRTRLSTTVAVENFAFLETLVSSGRTDSIAGAVDLAITRLRRAENRLRLDRATAAYFDGLAPEARTAEDAMALQLHSSAGGVDFDLEP
jgi:hypothetical protein